MPVSVYRRGEKRRSARVTMSVPLRVDGEALSGEKFTVNTTTNTISQYGCLMLLDQEVILDQALVLMNEYTRQSMQCRVVSTRRHRDGKKYVGDGGCGRRSRGSGTSSCRSGGHRARSMPSRTSPASRWATPRWSRGAGSWWSGRDPCARASR